MRKKYCIDQDKPLVEALKVIDANKQEFVIVTREETKLIGAMTDGDFRRHIISGGNVDVKVKQIANTGIITIFDNDSIGNAINIFKNEKVKFLPVIDSERNLVNIITKRKMQAALMMDLKLDLRFDFESIDENVIDYEVFPRPWGFYKTTVLNDFYQGKIISVNPGGKLSLQSHNHREEHWIVVHGEGEVQIDQSFVKVTCGSSVFLPKGCKHRLTNTGENDNLIITEVQIGDYLGEDDIIRYEDVYGRK